MKSPQIYQGCSLDPFKSGAYFSKQEEKCLNNREVNTIIIFIQGISNTCLCACGNAWHRFSENAVVYGKNGWGQKSPPPKYFYDPLCK